MATEQHAAFGDLLRQARQQAGLTQEALAELAGISPRAVSSLERGINRAPRRDTLDLLCTALDLAPEERKQWARARGRLAVRSQPASGTAAATRPVHMHLPAPLTSFLGRERALVEIQQMLTEARLVTVTGPGGVGKTRLAITLAEVEQRYSADGVCFVPLAPLGHPDLVVTTIIRALGIDETAERSPIETLSRFLRERSPLLLLDNFEHVVSAAPVISRLLEECPQLRILTTSRAMLRISGEREYSLRPLAEDASTALFVERSRDVRPDLDQSASQLAVIREICRRLDGLPLAIELAAARSRVLSPQALLERLEHPLTVLAGGPRDAPERQRTLRAAIAWSYDLLQPDEQALFRVLSIFRDGWSLEAAEAVCPDELDVLDGMTTLVESSLIEAHMGSDGEPRFRMLETIREFGLDMLQMHDGTEAVEERHARYMAGVVTETLPVVRGPQQADSLDRLETEHANIQMALDWFLEHDIEAGLRMAGALYPFWFFHSHLTVGRHYFDRLLAAADDPIDPVTLAMALTGAGIMTLNVSDLARDRAKDLHEQALSIWLDLRDPPEGAYWSFICLGIIETREGNLKGAEIRFQEALAYTQRHNQPYGTLHSHLMLANHSTWQGRLEDSLHHYQTALSLAREFHDPWTISVSSMNLANILAQQGRYDDAWPLLSEALGLSRRMKHHRDIAWALDRMAAIELKRGRFTDAKKLWVESLEAALKAGQSLGIGNARLGLGQIALEHGDVQDALDLFTQALDICLSAGYLPCIADSVAGLARLAGHLGKPEQAVQLHAAAIAFCEQTGIAAPQADRARLVREFVTEKNVLTMEQLDAAMDAGSALTPEQIRDRLPVLGLRPATWD